MMENDKNKKEEVRVIYHMGYSNNHPAHKDLQKAYGIEPIVKVKKECWPEFIEIDYIFPGFEIYYSTQQKNIHDENLSQIKIPKAGFLKEKCKPFLPSLGRYVQIPASCKVSNIEIIHCDSLKITTGDVKVESIPKNQGITVIPPKMSCIDYEEEDPRLIAQDAIIAHENNLEIECWENYEKDNPYPEIIGKPKLFEIDGYNAILVHIRPFQYRNIMNRELFFNYRIVIQIKMELREKIDSFLYNIGDSNNDNKAFRNFFLNPKREIIGKEVYKIPIKACSALYSKLSYITEPLDSSPEFLIIYVEKYKNAVEKLSKWKKKKGFRIEMFLIGKDINNSVSTIKEYIWFTKKRMFSRLGYVLLFGDVDDIETEKVPDKDNKVKFYSDYYYSTPKQKNNGELELPWLACGRIPVTDTDEAEVVVDQIINYERNPPCRSSYYNEISLAAFFQDSNKDGIAERRYVKTMEAIREKLCDYGLYAQRIYVADPIRRHDQEPSMYCDGTPIPDIIKNELKPKDSEELINALKTGKMIIAHRGHGDSSKWNKPEINMDDLKEIAEDSKTIPPSIVFGLNCLSGAFYQKKIEFKEKSLKMMEGIIDNGLIEKLKVSIESCKNKDEFKDKLNEIRGINDDTRKKILDCVKYVDCLSEAFLKLDGGPPSLIAATHKTDTWQNDSMMKALFDALWPGVLPTFSSTTISYPMKHSRIGDILNYAKAYLPLVHSEDDDTIKEQFEMYHVIGDPTLEIWKSEPKAIDIKWKERANFLYIELPYCPQGSIFTIWFDEGEDKEKFYKRIELSSTQIGISLLKILSDSDYSEISKISICFYAPGFRFRQLDVNISDLDCVKNIEDK